MGTFGSFGTVRLGIYAAQKGLDVTGNNITNINTDGYTRQRLNQVSLIPSASDRYTSSYNTRIGQGAIVTGVTQLRDPGLDISYRNASADVGAANAKLDGLNALASVLDEVGKGDLEQDDGVILSQLNDLRDLINQAITNNGTGTYDSLIRSSADALCTHFNSYAEKLAEKQSTYADKLDQQVTEVNNILKNIQELNVAIRNADIRGDEGLELRDSRNQMLDELSGYMKIDVKYSMEDVGAGTMVEKLTVTLANNPPHDHTLVDGEYATQLSCSDDGSYRITFSGLTNTKGEEHATWNKDVELLDNDLYGSLQSIRELLTEEGEYASDADVKNDPDAAIKRGIPYYQKALDSLAREFADAMNTLNDTGLTGGGALFSTGSNNNTTDGITASNISVSQNWTNGTVSIQATDRPDAPSGDTSNLAKFLALFDKKVAFDPKHIDGDAVGDAYNGTFEEMFLKIQSTLAEDQMTTDAVLNNYMVTANDVYVDRESIMGVDLNDEATSLMTYQKAYTAACRLMTVMEEALDSLINGTV